MRCVFEADPKAGREEQEAAFTFALAQIEQDLLTGTFDAGGAREYDKSIFPSTAAFDAFLERSKAAARCEDERDEEQIKTGRYGFRIELDANLFANPRYGLQRLVHTLASDIFERHVSETGGRSRASEDLDLAALKPAYEKAYRTTSHDIAAIQAAFRLKQNQPLLAFSLKPRACLSDEDYRYIVNAAFDGGCQIVELDTRDVAFDDPAREALLVELTEMALRRRADSQICCFSANLSGPALVIGPLLEKLSDVHAQTDPNGPWVVKIDGNLDGLSTIQAIRAGHFKLHTQPIITCYPVLKFALRSAIGRNAFVKMLALSGADIVYPGQSPKLSRSLGGIDTQEVAASQAHYKAMDLGGYPMLSVAGSVFVTAVHAYMSVFGSKIVFFPGGGIALSRQGIRKGTENFAHAIDLARRDLFAGEKIADLPAKFIDLARIYFADKTIPKEFDFVRPADLKFVKRQKSASIKE
jgi:ribulose 1,5-bisphosphate carboxylase large subunit-like protein